LEDGFYAKEAQTCASDRNLRANADAAKDAK